MACSRPSLRLSFVPSIPKGVSVDGSSYVLVNFRKYHHASSSHYFTSEALAPLRLILLLKVNTYRPLPTHFKAILFSRCGRLCKLFRSYWNIRTNLQSGSELSLLFPPDMSSSGTVSEIWKLPVSIALLPSSSLRPL